MHEFSRALKRALSGLFSCRHWRLRVASRLSIYQVQVCPRRLVSRAAASALVPSLGFVAFDGLSFLGWRDPGSEDGGGCRC